MGVMKTVDAERQEESAEKKPDVILDPMTGNPMF
jgi:hypothetical protein